MTELAEAPFGFLSEGVTASLSGGVVSYSSIRFGVRVCLGWDGAGDFGTSREGTSFRCRFPVLDEGFCMVEDFGVHAAGPECATLGGLKEECLLGVRDALVEPDSETGTSPKRMPGPLLILRMDSMYTLPMPSAFNF